MLPLARTAHKPSATSPDLPALSALSAVSDRRRTDSTASAPKAASAPIEVGPAQASPATRDEFGETSGLAERDAVFEVRGLTKSYGSRTILDGLDFDVLRGECLVVMGRSGTGKSVTLRQLNGLETPDSGTVTFEGVDLAGLSEADLYPYRRRIAMLFQSGALFDSMNVFDNVAFPLREHGDLSDEEIAQTVREKLAMVRLEAAIDKMPSDLSGGMKKRVALARSLALDPKVVLFDEPTTGLDPITSATIGRLIRTIQQELGVTSVVVTHDIPLARKVGDRIALLHEGRLRFLGTWSEAEDSSDRILIDFLAGNEESDEEGHEHEGGD